MKQRRTRTVLFVYLNAKAKKAAVVARIFRRHMRIEMSLYSPPNVRHAARKRRGPTGLCILD
jgi:hypothetical protein